MASHATMCHISSWTDFERTMIFEAKATRAPGKIAEEAAGWLAALKEEHFEQDGPYRDAAARNAAFCAWVKRSPAHLLLFMEMTELERRLNRLSESAKDRIRDLLNT